jgi:hypothetical protein
MIYSNKPPEELTREEAISHICYLRSELNKEEQYREWANKTIQEYEDEITRLQSTERVYEGLLWNDDDDD